MVTRKTITVPKDKQAEVDLDYDKASPEQIFEVKLTDEEFNELNAAGVFDLMNDLTSALIDEFESAEITIKEDLQKVLASDIFERQIKNERLNQIKVLFEEAIKRDTGVYFFF